MPAPSMVALSIGFGVASLIGAGADIGGGADIGAAAAAGGGAAAGVAAAVGTLCIIIVPLKRPPGAATPGLDAIS